MPTSSKMITCNSDIMPLLSHSSSASLNRSRILRSACHWIHLYINYLLYLLHSMNMNMNIIIFTIIYIIITITIYVYVYVYVYVYMYMYIYMSMYMYIYMSNVYENSRELIIFYLSNKLIQYLWTIHYFRFPRC